MALLEAIFNLGLDILAQPISKAKRISELINSGILEKLGSQSLSNSAIDSIVRRFGLGIGGEFSGAQRSRVVRELKRIEERRSRLVNQGERHALARDFAFNRDLFSEGLFGRRYRVAARWTVIDPETGFEWDTGGFLDFSNLPSMTEMREQAFRLSEFRIFQSPTISDDLGEVENPFVTGFEIVSMERAY